MALKIGQRSNPPAMVDARGIVGAEPPPSAAQGVAAYIEDIAGELEVLALGAKLDLLAYFLRLAQLEARSATGGATA